MCTFINTVEFQQCQICELKPLDNHQIAQQKEWSCSMCTYINNPQSTNCSMCEIVKPDSNNSQQQHSIVKYKKIYI